jgi:hypothetical protein
MSGEFSITTTGDYWITTDKRSKSVESTQIRAASFIQALQFGFDDREQYAADGPANVLDRGLDCALRGLHGRLCFWHRPLRTGGTNSGNAGQPTSPHRLINEGLMGCVRIDSTCGGPGRRPFGGRGLRLCCCRFGSVRLLDNLAQPLHGPGLELKVRF